MFRFLSDNAATERRHAPTPPPPSSAVSHTTGLLGLIGLLAGIAFAIHTGPLHLGAQLGLFVLAAAVPMVIYELAVTRTWARPSAGFQAEPHDKAESARRLPIKLAGLWATWAVIGLGYGAIRTYEGEQYEAFLLLLKVTAPLFFILSIPYVYLVDRFSRAPEDGMWHSGLIVLGRGVHADWDIARKHFLGWMIKAFFLALMVAVAPNAIDAVTGDALGDITSSPVLLALWLLNVALLVDLTFAIVGYALTFRVLDAHIRSPNPSVAGWTAALMCYPPISIMNTPLNYRDGLEWHDWLAGHDIALVAWGAILVALFGIYAWATVCFGVRFSNLTHRGILTHGPYRWTKHPAYLAKCTFWWLAFMPFLSMGGPLDAAMNSLLLVMVCGIYYWRAKTEEAHLAEDPTYRAYMDWMEAHGLFARLRRRVGLVPGRGEAAPLPAPGE